MNTWNKYTGTQAGYMQYYKKREGTLAITKSGCIAMGMSLPFPLLQLPLVLLLPPGKTCNFSFRYKRNVRRQKRVNLCPHCALVHANPAPTEQTPVASCTQQCRQKASEVAVSPHTQNRREASPSELPPHMPFPSNFTINLLLAFISSVHTCLFNYECKG